MIINSNSKNSGIVRLKYRNNTHELSLISKFINLCDKITN